MEEKYEIVAVGADDYETALAESTTLRGAIRHAIELEQGPGDVDVYRVRATGETTLVPMGLLADYGSDQWLPAGQIPLYFDGV